MSNKNVKFMTSFLATLHRMTQKQTKMMKRHSSQKTVSLTFFRRDEWLGIQRLKICLEFFLYYLSLFHKKD
jgi:hypothetical protein